MIPSCLKRFAVSFFILPSSTIPKEFFGYRPRNILSTTLLSRHWFNSWAIRLKRRYERISKICKDLSEEAFKSYAGKRDYKRALEIYSLLATSDCVPSDISNFSKNMLGRLNKKIEENT